MKESNSFVPLYLGFVFVSLVVNSVIFWKDEHFFWSMSGGIFAVLFLLFIIGYFNDKRLFLWIGAFSIVMYTAYAIGVLIWSFSTHTVHIFLIIFVIVFAAINFFILFHTREKINLLTKQ